MLEQPAPLISVIIPCYNHGHFLSVSIQSIIDQHHKNVEIIVVDDGSVPPVKNVVAPYPQVHYIFQKNQGLSAARNTGFAKCHGKYVVFLDADDLLYPAGLKANLEMLETNPKLAFVSGCHNVTHNEDGLLDDSSTVVTDGAYVELLKRNYIGMNGAVMYQRWALEKFKFEPSLRACEDYDHYLKITREYPVMHHNAKIAEYRKHGSNMSDDPVLMYCSATEVLRKHKPLLRNAAEQVAYRQGMDYWTSKYIDGMFDRLFSLKAGIKSATKLKIIYDLKYPLLKMFIRRSFAKAKSV